MLLYRICPGCRAVASRGGGSRGVCRFCLSAADPAERFDPPAGLVAAAALYHYDDLVQRIVVAAKNGGRRDVARQLGRLLAGRLGQPDPATVHRRRPHPTGDPLQRHRHLGHADEQPGWDELSRCRFDVITWVPGSSGGVRRRGYDQGRLLARAAAAELGLPSQRLLIRRRGRGQAGLGRAQRIAGPALRAPVQCPARILLVDDVITTGTSMSAAAEALRRSGARSVVGLAVARAGEIGGARHPT